MKGKVFKEPIFNGIVEGRITQFREIVKPQPDFVGTTYGFASKDDGRIINPRFGVGDKVYLKEPYCIIPAEGLTQNNPADKLLAYIFPDKRKIAYKYSDTEVVKSISWNGNMPANLARYFIEITALRCEQAQDISDEDCMKEGIKKYGEIATMYGFADDGEYFIYGKTPRKAYSALFDRIHGKGAWGRSPYCFVYEFKLIKR